MEAFIMNRFRGLESGKSDESKEDRILARLNARKGKKTLQQLYENEENENQEAFKLRPDVNEAENAENEGVPKKAKKRKRDKDREVPQPETEKISNEEENEETKENNVEEAPATEIGNDEEPQFTILGEVEQKEAEKVHRVLPDWLQKPSTISCSLTEGRQPVADIPGLSKHILNRLQKNKITHLFPVQQQVIPWLLESQRSPYLQSDICVSAPTGSGKTLAFVLPIVQASSSSTVCRVRALVILPVHDLAVQVYRVFQSYCTGTSLNVALISGHAPFTQEQENLVRRGKCGHLLSKVDIVVCTPGRLVDHINRTPGFSLADLRYIVIDEADRIIEETHNDWLLHVEKATNSGSASVALVARSLTQPPARHVQKLLFSATLSQDPEKLYRLGLFQPKLFTSVVKRKADEEENTTSMSHRFIGKYTTPAELSEKYVVASQSMKPVLVHHLVAEKKFKPALCFTASRASTHRLCLLLSNMGGIKVEEFSGQFNKARREKLLRDFSNGSIDLLVCTDAVARGMDLGVVDCVISYDPPLFVKNYIHRAGRTARAGRPGTAITLLVDEQVDDFQELLRSAEKDSVEALTVPMEELEHYENNYKEAIDSLKQTLNTEKINKSVKSSVLRRKGSYFKRTGPQFHRKSKK